jgi:hypothetical protein
MIELNGSTGLKPADTRVRMANIDSILQIVVSCDVDCAPDQVPCSVPSESDLVEILSGCTDRRALYRQPCHIQSWFVEFSAATLDHDVNVGWVSDQTTAADVAANAPWLRQKKGR